MSTKTLANDALATDSEGHISLLTQQHQESQQDQADGSGPQPPGGLSVPHRLSARVRGSTHASVITLTHCQGQDLWGVTLPTLIVLHDDWDAVHAWRHLLLGS